MSRAGCRDRRYRARRRGRRLPCRAHRRLARDRCGSSGSPHGDVRQPLRGEQPIGLAEFNFAMKDRDAPWYDVSYVNAFSLPITIAPRGAENVTKNGSCSKQG
ncbi:thaumatin family protein [Streptomyces sp. NPDC001852]|uniref:thaumatin family protein n=1 Tax=Streptomyces sp. NPDC001852 TaxID=3364619 RepID=UPI003694B6DE